MRKLTEDEIALSIVLLSLHDTPTELIRKAFKADSCDLHLTFGDHEVIVRDVNHKEKE